MGELMAAISGLAAAKCGSISQIGGCVGAYPIVTRTV